MSTTAKLSARQRIEALLDENSFVEIGAGVTARSTDFNLNKKDTPADGVITGYGVIDGNLVYVYSQDSSVLGGSIGEMHAKKIVRMYQMARKMGAPVVALIDCSGIRVEESTDALNAFGEIYKEQAMNSGVVASIAAIFGQCGGGLSTLAALSDFTFMAEDAKLFVNSPNALPNNYEEKCDTASAKYQSTETGNVDFTGTETEVLAGIRNLVDLLPANFEIDDKEVATADDLNRAVTVLGYESDSAVLASQIADDGDFFELKKDFAKDMTIGFIRLNGKTVGIVGNTSKKYDEEYQVVEEFDGKLSGKGALKAADFVSFCDAFSIPIVTFTNVNGFSACKCYEKTLAKNVAKLTAAFANTTAPKINVITGEAYGSAYVSMNSKGTGADLVYAWKNVKIGVLESKLAASVVAKDDNQAEIAASFEALQNNVAEAAARGYVDTIIEPSDTRKYLIAAVEMLDSKLEYAQDKKHTTR